MEMAMRSGINEHAPLWAGRRVMCADVELCYSICISSFHDA
jgi:hypothetical protein